MCLRKFIFDCLKVYHQSSTKPEMGQTLMLLTSEIPSYNLLGINLNFLKTQHTHTRHEFWANLWWTLGNHDTYVGKSMLLVLQKWKGISIGTKSSCDICEWSQLLAQNGIYWFYDEFSDIVFSISLCLSHRKVINAALMALDEILYVYRTHAAHMHAKREWHLHIVIHPSQKK